MKPCVLALALLITCGCSSTPVSRDWTDCGNPGFIATVNALTSSGTADCGFDDLLGYPNQSRGNKEAYDCMKRSALFKYGMRRIAFDSVVYEAVVRTGTSEYWSITHDFMVGDDRPQQWIKRCKAMRIGKGPSFESDQCVETEISESKQPRLAF